MGGGEVRAKTTVPRWSLRKKQAGEESQYAGLASQVARTHKWKEARTFSAGAQNGSGEHWC